MRHAVKCCTVLPFQDSAVIMMMPAELHKRGWAHARAAPLWCKKERAAPPSMAAACQEAPHPSLSCQAPSLNSTRAPDDALGPMAPGACSKADSEDACEAIKGCKW
jgi:hypothetical protein